MSDEAKITTAREFAIKHAGRIAKNISNGMLQYVSGFPKGDPDRILLSRMDGDIMSPSYLDTYEPVVPMEHLRHGNAPVVRSQGGNLKILGYTLTEEYFCPTSMDGKFLSIMSSRLQDASVSMARIEGDLLIGLPRDLVTRLAHEEGLPLKVEKMLAQFRETLRSL